MKTNTVTITLFPTYKEISVLPVYFGGKGYQAVFENSIVSESYDRDRENLESMVTKFIDVSLNGIKGRSAAKTKLQKINFLLEHGCGYYFSSNGKITRKGSEQSAECDFYGNTTPIAAAPTPIAVKPAPIAAAPTPIAVKPAPIAVKPEPAPIAAKPAPIAVKPAPIATAVKPTPATPIAVKPALIAVKPALIAQTAAETADRAVEVNLPYLGDTVKYWWNVRNTDSDNVSVVADRRDPAQATNYYCYGSDAIKVASATNYKITEIRMWGNLIPVFTLPESDMRLLTETLKTAGITLTVWH